jgi:hypothetical protein
MISHAVSVVVYIFAALLRRVCVDGPLSGIHPHVCARNARRVVRMDCRLGLSAGICCRGGRCSQHLVGILLRGHGDCGNTAVTEFIERADHLAQHGYWPTGDDRSVSQSSRGARRDRVDGALGLGHTG